MLSASCFGCDASDWICKLLSIIVKAEMVQTGGWSFVIKFEMTFIVCNFRFQYLLEVPE